MDFSSAFPKKVDDLLFYQDIDISNANVFNQYQKLLSSGRHTEAAEYIQKSGVPYYGAPLFNLIENMIYAVQTYLLENSPRTNPHIVSDAEPANAPSDTIWIN